jgi:hypothetical protein
MSELPMKMAPRHTVDTDDGLGFGIRFTRHYEPTKEIGSDFDHAWLLVSQDHRDVPIGQKIADVVAFLKSRKA